MAIIGVGAEPVTTRASIESDIANYLKRQDLAPFIKGWFNIAHREIQRRRNFAFMQLTGIIKVLEQSDVNKEKLPLIPPFDKIKNLQIGYTFDTAKQRIIVFYNKTNIETVRMRRHATDELNPFFTAPLMQLIPAFDNNLCAVWQDFLEVWPFFGQEQVGQEFRIDCHIWVDPPTPDVSDWLTINARDYLLYRSLQESAPFLVDDPRIELWKGLAFEARNTVLGAEIESLVEGDLVMGG